MDIDVSNTASWEKFSECGRRWIDNRQADRLDKLTTPFAAKSVPGFFRTLANPAGPSVSYVGPEGRRIQKEEEWRKESQGRPDPRHRSPRISETHSGIGGVPRQGPLRPRDRPGGHGDAPFGTPCAAMGGHRLRPPRTERQRRGALIDDSGLSARTAADQLGHARASMTQDVYMNRGRIHTEVASALDRAAGITDE